MCCTVLIHSIRHPSMTVTCLTKFWFSQSDLSPVTWQKFRLGPRRGQIMTILSTWHYLLPFSLAYVPWFVRVTPLLCQCTLYHHHFVFCVAEHTVIYPWSSQTRFQLPIIAFNYIQASLVLSSRSQPLLFDFGHIFSIF